VEVEIREVEESDLEGIRDLNMASWLEAYGGIIPEEKIREEVDYTKESLNTKEDDEKLVSW
jgi:hypothetical protein